MIKCIIKIDKLDLISWGISPQLVSPEVYPPQQGMGGSSSGDPNNVLYNILILCIDNILL